MATDVLNDLELLHLILDLCPQAFIVWEVPEINPSAAGLILAYANAKANVMALRNVTDQFGKTMGELFPTAVGAEHNFPALVFQVYSTGEPITVSNLKYLYQDKTYYYNLHLVSLTKGLILSMLTNVTEQIDADQQVLDSISSFKKNLVRKR